MPSTFFDDCCLRKRNIFSIVTTSNTVTVSHRPTVYSNVHHRRWSPSTYHDVCHDQATHGHIMCSNQTVHEAVVRMCSWTTLSAQKMHNSFARHVPSSREVLIENTLKCPCLSMSSSRTSQIRCASSLSSHRIWKPPVVRCSMHQRLVIGCLS